MTGHYLAQLQQQQEAAEAHGKQTLEEMTRSWRGGGGGGGGGSGGGKATGDKAVKETEERKRTKKVEAENYGEDHISVDSLEEDNQSEIGKVIWIQGGRAVWRQEINCMSNSSSIPTVVDALIKRIDDVIRGFRCTMVPKSRILRYHTHSFSHKLGCERASTQVKQAMWNKRMSERCELMNERVAQYLHLNSWLF